MNNQAELLRQLAMPLPPESITWKPGATTKDGTKCMAMAYGDLRAYMERLDELCGLDWSVRYQPWQQERIICELTIHGVTRSSTGEYGKQDEANNIEGTVAEAQAFKRACAMFGLGRYLYDLPSVWVEFDSAAKKITKAGQAELDNRYKAWYAKTMAAQSSAKMPTDAELEILGTWQTPQDAQAWAMKVEACSNEFEAHASFKKVVDAHGGKLTKENIAVVYLDYLRKQNRKLEERKVAA